MNVFKNKFICFFFLGISFFVDVKAQNQEKRNWLIQAYDNVYPKGNAFANLSQWQNNQSINVAKAIQALPDSIKQRLSNQAEKANVYKWPAITASLYLDYKLTGNRVNYESLLNERRKMLVNLVAGELIENKEKYIPQIVNGLWLILEESTWVWPAHIVVQKDGSGLPNIENPYIDLNASKTALTLATIYNMLGPKLKAYSKVVDSRILYELNRRIFDPYLKFNNFGWMGFKGNSVNNWNTYINANTLQAALLILPPGEKLSSLTSKLLKSTDNFINQYPEDGGCDEGPSYWDMAGGRLISLMTTLNQVSDGKLSWTQKELIHKMGSYTYNMQIAGNYVVNFADATAKYLQNPVSVYQYGVMFNDEKLKDYASFIYNSGLKPITSDDISDFIAKSNLYVDLKLTTAKAPYPVYAVFPDLQVFNARQKEGSTEGLFFAAKGGNNAESHNHNDIGNFIVYSNGKPVLIDAGVGVYTSKTFSGKRYELWNVQSQWHNCPTINGVQQQNGKKFAATNFKFSNSNNTASVSMDIAPAYPQAAMVEKWNRTISLNRVKNEISLVDEMKLHEYIAPTELNFLTPLKVEIIKGAVLFPTGLELNFDENKFEAKVDEQQIDDARLAAVWGAKIYRIRLITKHKEKSGTYKFSIKSNQ